MPCFLAQLMPEIPSDCCGNYASFHMSYVGLFVVHSKMMQRERESE